MGQLVKNDAGESGCAITFNTTSFEPENWYEIFRNCKDDEGWTKVCDNLGALGLILGNLSLGTCKLCWHCFGHNRSISGIIDFLCKNPCNCMHDQHA